MEENRTENVQYSSSTHSNPWLLGLVIVLLVAAGIGLSYGFSQRHAMSRLAATNQDLMGRNQALNSTVGQMDSTMGQMRAQMNALNAKVATLSAPPARPLAKTRAVRHAAVRHPRVDPRWKKVQAQIDAQQTQLKQMQNQVAKNRSDLEGELGSTRDNLNGSIARTHDELVALEKRGERDYFEFDLSKSKNFQRVGPVLLSLRKADSKHDHYNLNILVDDKQISKKNVNLYEPVWLFRNDDPQPLQVVVNQIDKNFVHGYVSAPKYTKSQLAAAAAQPAPVSPNPPVNQMGGQMGAQPVTQPSPSKQPDVPRPRN